MPLVRWFCCLLAFLQIAWPTDPSSEVARDIAKLRLDPRECYRLTSADLSKGPLSLHLGPGWIIFAEPIRGVRPGAVYLSSSGENRVSLAPVAVSERLALEKSLHKTALNEPFGKSLLLFTDGTDAVLRSVLDGQQAAKDPAKGAALAQEWASIFAHIADSFHTRLVRDLIGGDRTRGVFYAGVATKTVGDIDIFYDPSATEEAVIGRLDAGRFEILATCCESNLHPSDANVTSYRIDTTVQPDLHVSAIATATVQVNASSPVLVFSISRVMNIVRAEVDGVSAPVFQSQSLRSHLLRDQGAGEFFIVAPAELKSGSLHQVQIEFEGKMIERLSNGELLVGARENWYPRAGDSPAAYDLTFRSSPELMLIASGKPVAEYLEGESRVSQWRIGVPVKYATFNVGRFGHIATKRNNFNVEIYYPDTNAGAPELGPELIPATDSIYPAGAQRIGDLALQMMTFMTASLGPVPVNALTISPMPGPFGQNLSGSVFLSSSLYKEFSAEKKDAAADSPEQRVRYQIGVPHEIAHQWWGNAVRPATYHDEWIMEALANYSALLFREEAGENTLTAEAMEQYRKSLARKTPEGRTVSELGPVTWGYRLQEQFGGSAWRTLTYGKGTVIFHELRRRMGDTAFEQFLRTLFTEFQTRPLSTPELERWAARYIPEAQAKAFFDTCVNGTSMP